MGLRERKKAMTRKAISDIATRLFLERGYHAVTTAEIAAAADVSVATLFTYFPSKETLVFDEDGAMESALVDAVVLRPTGASIISSVADFILAGPAFRAGNDPAYAAFADMIRATPELATYMRGMSLRYADALAEAIAISARGTVTPARASAIARYLIEAVTIAQTTSDPAATFTSLVHLLTTGTSL